MIQVRNVGIVFVPLAVLILSFKRFADEKRDGKIFIAGKAYDRQIYVIREKRPVPVTRFKRWENIIRHSLAPDRKHFVVYHRGDKETSHRLSVYDLKNTTKRFPLKSIRPGVACHKLFWFRNRILFETGTSGGGTFLLIYDQNLNLIHTIHSFDLYLDQDSGIAISKPVYPMEEGKFSVYALYSGDLLETFDFAQEIGEAYSVWDLKKIGLHKFEIELIVDTSSDQRRIFSKTIRPRRKKTRTR